MKKWNKTHPTIQVLQRILRADFFHRLLEKKSRKVMWKIKFTPRDRSTSTPRPADFPIRIWGVWELYWWFRCRLSGVCNEALPHARRKSILRKKRWVTKMKMKEFSLSLRDRKQPPHHQSQLRWEGSRKCRWSPPRRVPRSHRQTFSCTPCIREKDTKVRSI